MYASCERVHTCLLGPNTFEFFFKHSLIPTQDVIKARKKDANVTFVHRLVGAQLTRFLTPTSIAQSSHLAYSSNC